MLDGGTLRETLFRLPRTSDGGAGQSLACLQRRVDAISFVACSVFALGAVMDASFKKEGRHSLLRGKTGGGATREQDMPLNSFLRAMDLGEEGGHKLGGLLTEGGSLF